MDFNFCPMLIFDREAPLQIWTTHHLAQMSHFYFTTFVEPLPANQFLMENEANQSKEDKTGSSQTELESSCIVSPFLKAESIHQKKKIFEDRPTQSSLSRNETKNIPKNYGKAMLNFIETDPSTKILAEQMNLNYPEILMRVRKIKKKVGSIQTLRKMWGSENLENDMKKCFRILSFRFMREHCLDYIFSSKVKDVGVHVKYRRKIMEGIQNPAKFTFIKEF